MKSHRVNQEFSSVKEGDFLMIGKNGLIATYLVVERDVTRGKYAHSILKVKNTATGDLLLLDKKDLLKDISSLESIGHRKVNRKSLNSSSVTILPAPVVVTPVELTKEAEQPKPIEKVSVADSVFADLEANIEKEIEEIAEINRLFESGKNSQAMDRLRQLN